VSVLALVAATIAWEPLVGVRDLDARLAVAHAIVSTDADPHEQLLLARIALLESRMVPRVGRCAPGTTGGGRGAWQNVPRTRSDYLASCGPLEEQASLALERVRESLEVCAHRPEDEQLGVYAAGSCSSKRARRLSRERWVTAP
jgi:hypothetical protein